MKLDWIGWIATALFASSYLFKQPMALRKVQALAALLWVVYGLMIHALPVVVANVVVAAVAVGSALPRRPRCSPARRALTPPSFTPAETASSDAR
jgi:hypothetical protein